MRTGGHRSGHGRRVGRARGERGALTLPTGWLVAVVAVLGATTGVVVQQVALRGERTVEATIAPDGSPEPPVAGLSPAGRAAVAVVECPGGPAVDQLHSLDRVLLTGVHAEDDSWFRIRHPLAPERPLWISAAAVTPDAEVDDLPVARCEEAHWALGSGEEGNDEEDGGEERGEDGEAGGDGGGADATTTTTAPAPGPTTPTTPAPAPGPTTVPPLTTSTTRPAGPTTTAPDTQGPSVGSIGRSPAEIYQSSTSHVCSKPTSSLISATVTDPAGVTSVVLHVSLGAQSATLDMHHTAGGVYRVQLGPFPENTIAQPSASITVKVVATDGLGNVSERTGSPVTLYRDC